MTTRSDSIRVLSRALDQAGDVLARVRPEQLDGPTPCSDWTVGRLVDHLVADPGNFALMLHGEQPDWSSPPEVAEGVDKAVPVRCRRPGACLAPAR